MNSHITCHVIMAEELREDEELVLPGVDSKSVMKVISEV